MGLPWILAVFQIVFAFGAFFEPAAGVTAQGIGALATAGATAGIGTLDPRQQTSDYLSSSDLQDLVETMGKNSRALISTWANDTFYGVPDKAGATILCVPTPD